MLDVGGRRQLEARRGQRRGRSAGGSLKIALAAAALLLSSCGYHVAGHSDLLPQTIHTIAIPAFSNATTRYKLTERLPEALAREFIARSRYRIVSDPNKADA